MLPKILYASACILPLWWSASLAQSTSRACNNSPDLCSQSYGNITQLGAHDSPFLRDASTGFSTSGNQFYDSIVQLDAGVRLLSTQVHFTNGTSGTQSLHLCHSSCDLLDAGTLSDWLSTIKTWLDGNPNEVVTLLLVNADTASAEQLHAQFQAANIVSYGYVPPTTSAPLQVWPTLEELISANTRLLTFVTNLPAASNTVAPYLMDQFTYIFETPFENFQASDFNCVVDRPSGFADASAAIAAGLLPLKNHFLYDSQLFGIEVPNVENLNVTNSPSFEQQGSVGTEALECATQWDRGPSFILVDFFNVGPAIDAVDRLNGVQDPVGRQQVATATLTRSAAGENHRSSSLLAIIVPLVMAIAWSGGW